MSRRPIFCDTCSRFTGHYWGVRGGPKRHELCADCQHARQAADSCHRCGEHIEVIEVDGNTDEPAPFYCGSCTDEAYNEQAAAERRAA
jgi:hypothetical protein